MLKPQGMRLLTLIAGSLVLTRVTIADPPQPFHAPPGAYVTSWVGNTFGGSGGQNGFGYWVQEGVSKLVVTPDGTAFCGVAWDEAGRDLGLYKNGQVNRVLLQQPHYSTSGFGLSNTAFAVYGSHIYVANTDAQLLRFTWTPGDINSAKYVDYVKLPEKKEVVGLTANNDYVVLAYKDGIIELRKANDLLVFRQFSLSGVKDVAFGRDGSLWILVGARVQHVTLSGQVLPPAITGLQDPTAIAISNHNPNQLLVCDNGPRQQVLFYDLKPHPHLVKTFGAYGGLMSGQPGEVKPNKLFGLRGANTDADGNLYVAMSFVGGASGHCVLRCFDSAGKMKWQDMSLAFVDTFGFDPSSDGTTVYSRDAIMQLDLKKRQPGSEWSLKAFTVVYPSSVRDPREDTYSAASVVVRRLKGTRVLYTIGQMGGGFDIYAFNDPKHPYIPRKVGTTPPTDGTWAWYVDADGGIWWGDAPDHTIRYYPFQGWNEDGTPRYDWKNPQTWPWPQDFDSVTRAIFIPKSDTLYLFGYLKGQDVETWGVVGPTARRYDDWLSGNPKIVWTNTHLPTAPDSQGKPITAKMVDIAGDYLFVGMVFSSPDGNHYTHIFRTSDGGYIGSFVPGDSVGGGGNVGWCDMPYALQAFKRSNGEYLVLEEEDWRGKNLLYRWWPKAETETSTR
ncbi:MAG TPA: hypothetical protein VKV29_01835 [Chthonomonas sp.]|jgi:hypothetical protein|uniref:hypothetical protein n=1 Tax=Chthonomonas sp. TaxID=2282153 RepID=UPI002B4B4A4E|nr:hypothetical protein [Chthonomonas sp.]HLH79004.1 hypothetical protein [Chthonomonas sp.]